MEKKIYYIGGEEFVTMLTLLQDELLSPITSQMLQEVPEIVETTAIMTDAIHAKKEVNTDKAATVSINLLKSNTWILKNGYGRKICALLLVKKGKQYSDAELLQWFSEEEIAKRELFFAIHASREIAKELLGFFFGRSVAFPTSST